MLLVAIPLRPRIESIRGDRVSSLSQFEVCIAAKKERRAGRSFPLRARCVFFALRMTTPENLVEENFDPFLVYDSFNAINHVIGDYKKRFKISTREKGLAVSDDGKTLRMVLESRGYNDRFLFEEGECVLSYVCGEPEERRRQSLNKEGDSIMVTLGRKAVYNNKKLVREEAHGVLHGVFKRIEAQRDVKPDGRELLIPRTYVRILGYEREPGRCIHFSQEGQQAQPSRREEVPRPLKKPKSHSKYHLVIDTESASPLDFRLLGKKHDPFPVLEVAYYKVGWDFKRVIHIFSAVLNYDDSLRKSLGNDESSAVLKMPLQELRDGDGAVGVYDVVAAEMNRTVEEGGLIIAHNVLHDLRQLKATADLLGRPFPEKIRALDTVKTAANFVPGAEKRWMKLADLASLCDIPTRGAVNGGLHYAADDALLLLDVLRESFPPDGIEAYAEEYTL